MALSESQRVTLAAHIRANTDPDVVAALAIRNDSEITKIYNLDSSFIVWKSNVEPSEYRMSINWAEADTLNAGKARIWEWITGQMELAINPSDANIRSGIAEAWAANTSTRANLLAIAKRPASLGESVFATGTGSDASPGVLVFEGTLTTSDVGRALNENP